ncbi:MAG: FAH family protein, partial [Sphingobium sp.]
TLSFSDGVTTQEGDVFEIDAAPFTLPLRNPLARAQSVNVAVRAL